MSRTRRIPPPLLLLLAFLLAMATAHAFAQTAWPALTGRVVDNANIVPQATRTALTAKLRDLEDRSGIQLVVATVPSLGGGDIESYANGLFRNWKLGQAGRNNGVLLIVAPNERKIRIEVGYGLEGTLTDALSRIIIANAIAPRFKAGDFGGGISRGIDDIIAVLTTDASEWQKRPGLRAEPQQDAMDIIVPAFVFIVFVFLLVSILSRASRPGRWVKRGNRTIFLPTPGGFSGSSSGGSWSSGWDSSGSSWSSGGDSFSGGGGDSGGGGASGDW